MKHAVLRYLSNVLFHVGHTFIDWSKALYLYAHPEIKAAAEAAVQQWTPPPQPKHDPCTACLATESEVWLNGLCETCAQGLYGSTH